MYHRSTNAHINMLLRHCGRSPRYASLNWVIIGGGNGLSPVRCRAIISTNAISSLISETNLSEIRTKIPQFF